MISGVGWYRLALAVDEAQLNQSLQLVAAGWCGASVTAWLDAQPLGRANGLPKSAAAIAFVLPTPARLRSRRLVKPAKPRALTVRVDGFGARCPTGYGLTGYLWLVRAPSEPEESEKIWGGVQHHLGSTTTSDE